ncbi:hypothetical protein BO83DRAFT_325326, partial [Aspergillus eucalypticola CBS 122712]
IYFFKNLTRVSILFIFKNNNNLYFYINYRDFNKVFIKNYYSLFLISEILVKISGNKYF